MRIKVIQILIGQILVGLEILCGFHHICDWFICDKTTNQTIFFLSFVIFFKTSESKWYFSYIICDLSLFLYLSNTLRYEEKHTNAVIKSSFTGLRGQYVFFRWPNRVSKNIHASPLSHLKFSSRLLTYASKSAAHIKAEPRSASCIP